MKKYIKLGSGGVKGGTAYHYNRLAGRHMHPTFLVYQLTDMCNSRCSMCSIWKKRPHDELTTQEIAKIFSSSLWSKLRWINLTGGEPFLRKDFLDVIRILGKLPKLEGIAVPSNGFLTERIVSSVKEALKILGSKKFLSVTLSVDGFEKTHDRIRGVPGAYKKVMKTLEKLKEVKKSHRNFNVGVQPTISRINIDEIEDFYRFIRKKTPSVGFAVTMTSSGYYDNLDRGAALSNKDRAKIAAFFRKIIKEDPQYAYYYSKLIDLFRTGRRGFTCLAGFLTLYMDPHGDIYPCPVLSARKEYHFGNARENPTTLWFSKDSRKKKKLLESEKECLRCTMMCDFINVAKVEFFEFSFFMLSHPKILSRLLRKIKNEPNPYF